MLVSRPVSLSSGQVIEYTAQISDTQGRPLVATEVSMKAIMADGSAVTVYLEPGVELGTYRAMIPRAPVDVRIRVLSSGKHFEVPLAS